MSADWCHQAPLPGNKVFAISILFVICSVMNPLAAIAAAPFLNDHFDGASLDPKLWYIPTHEASGDGTFVGRTQFRVAPDSPLPAVSGSNVCIPLQTFNPKALSFYGAEIITRQEFVPGTGLDVIVRARMENARNKGIVGGLFLYFLEPGSDTVHDEIDVELLTNVPDRVQTNIYGHEPLGVGHAQLIPYRSGSITDYHTYEIKWTRDLVSWIVDGEMVRTVTSNMPTHAMRFYANIWAPDPGWPQGYSDTIQPVKSKDSDVVLSSLCVDSVVIRPLAP